MSVTMQKNRFWHITISSFLSAVIMLLEGSILDFLCCENEIYMYM